MSDALTPATAINYIRSRIRFRPDNGKQSWQGGILERVEGMTAILKMTHGKIVRVELDRCKPWHKYDGGGGGGSTQAYASALATTAGGGVEGGVVRERSNVIRQMRIDNAIDLTLDPEKTDKLFFGRLPKGKHYSFVPRWYGVSISKIGIRADIVSQLRIAGLHTIGQLGEFSQSGGRLGKDVWGIGKEHSSIIADALEKFWKTYEESDDFAADVADYEATDRAREQRDAEKQAVEDQKRQQQQTAKQQKPINTPAPPVPAPAAATSADVSEDVRPSEPAADAAADDLPGVLSDPLPSTDRGRPGDVAENREWMVVDFATRSYYDRRRGAFSTDPAPLNDPNVSREICYRTTRYAHTAVAHLSKVSPSRQMTVVSREQVMDWLTDPHASKPVAVAAPAVEPEKRSNPFFEAGEVMNEIELIDDSIRAKRETIDALTQDVETLTVERADVIARLQKLRERIDNFLKPTG
jgi:hypothetical protein